jgi:hypothetical protein
MLYCPKCGTKLRSNAKFCHHCGAEVRVDIVSQDTRIEEKGEVKKNSSMIEKLPFDISMDIELEKCGRYGKEYNIVCSFCHENNIIQSSAFTTGLKKSLKIEITATNERITVASGLLNLVSRIIPGIIAIILGSYIGTIIIGIPFLWAILAFIFYLIFKPFTDKLLNPFIRKIPIWIVKCKKCGEKTVLASDGFKTFIIRKKRKK